MDYTTMPDDVIACVMTHYKTGLNKRGMERARAKAHKDITMRQLFAFGRDSHCFRPRTIKDHQICVWTSVVLWDHMNGAPWGS